MLLQIDWWIIGEKLVLVIAIVSLSMLVAMYSTQGPVG